PRMNRSLPAGWWCSDGDNFVKGNVLQFYPDSVILSARPCAALAVYARVSIPARGVPQIKTTPTVLSKPSPLIEVD
ncbi:MAG: hypothetical protein ACLQUY_19185, partial [Ktedonobacterales bacterium]